jgi:hypothetical protein
MAVTNMDALKATLWASAFDQIDKGTFNLQNQVSRDVEQNLVSQKGKTVAVPVSPDATDASEWDGISDVTDDTQAAATVNVTLEKIFVKRQTFSSSDISMHGYDLIKEMGVPLAEGLISANNKYLINKMLASRYFIDGRSSFTEDSLTDARTKLSKNKASLSGRVAIMSPDDTGVLLKRDAFKLAQNAGTDEAQKLGELGMKSGLRLGENHALETYTPADIAGAVNNGSGIASGATFMDVDSFADSATPVKIGDIFQVAGETGSPLHTIIATTKTSGATTGISFYPALASSVADNAVVTVIPTRSVLCFTPNCIAYAAKTLAELPAGKGADCAIVNVQGIPVRITTKITDNLGIFVQMDNLVGAELIRDSRIVRILR